MQLCLMVAGLLVAVPFAQRGESASEILEALRLPALAVEARQAGVSEARVRQLLDGLRGRGLPADEAAFVVREEVDAVHAGAPKDDFGEFVQQQLDAGHRGRALADAIRAEHRARGIGRPQAGRQGRPVVRGQDTIRPRGRRP